MTDTYSDTRVVSILDRRRQLKRQRRSQFWQAVWRTSAILGFTLGLGWLFGRPEWQIRKASQVEIVGNRQIATETLETFLPLSFPTSLLRVKPSDIKTMLEHNTPIDQVLVHRQLFPPRLQVRVYERSPVAVTACRNCVLVVPGLAAAPITLGPSDLWLMDAQGIVLPYESYPKLKQMGKVPELSVSSYLRPLDAQLAKAVPLKNISGQPNLVALDSTLQKEWQAIYGPIHSSPVKIQELNWQNPNNLSLKTELGLVQIGPFSPSFSKQLRALDQMRALPQTVETQKIKLINLENPEHPAVELNVAPQLPKIKSSP